MTKTHRMKRIESERKMPLEELLPVLYADLHTDLAVARELGISAMRLSQWLDLLQADVRRERSVEHRTTVSFPHHTAVR